MCKSMYYWQFVGLLKETEDKDKSNLYSLPTFIGGVVGGFTTCSVVCAPTHDHFFLKERNVCKIFSAYRKNTAVWILHSDHTVFNELNLKLLRRKS